MKIIASILGGMVAGVLLAAIAFAWLNDLTPGHVLTGALAGLFCSHPMVGQRTWKKDILISTLIVTATTVLLLVLDSAVPFVPQAIGAVAIFSLLSGFVLGTGTYLGARFVSRSDPD